MPGTLVQSKPGTTPSAATSLTVTFDTPPVENNLLIAVAGSDSVMTMASTGWSTPLAATDFTDLKLWYKVAGAGEASAVQITHASDQSEMAIFEYSGMFTVTPQDKTATSMPGTSTATVPSGTTATLTQADELAIAAWCRQGSAAVNSISNSFSEVCSIGGLGGTRTTMTVAVKDLSSTAAASSTAVFASASSNPSGLIATFKVALGPVSVSAGEAVAVSESNVVIVPQLIFPDADLDATGWSTAPLWSKVSDESDATVITSQI